jgi:hypothetical protein
MPIRKADSSAVMAKHKTACLCHIPAYKRRPPCITGKIASLQWNSMSLAPRGTVLEASVWVGGIVWLVWSHWRGECARSRRSEGATGDSGAGQTVIDAGWADCRVGVRAIRITLMSPITPRDGSSVRSFPIWNDCTAIMAA